MFLESERRRVAEFGRRMSAEGLSNGTSGNLSVYVPEEGYMVLSPSGMRYEDIQPEDVVVMTWTGRWPPGGGSPPASGRCTLTFIGKSPRSGAWSTPTPPTAPPLPC